ncbi:hypothetical protein PAPYR_11062 [Paratrimastix pyriformis]|uniref:Uncharacterized protein n=1 Tax=Paratrimastix pyriformis TaxID=342808 RepID=A0ABQ8U4J2_9EUKA|nr:hypothetical protein PAPYR_11062 [Paratrimastix pyriformis]
MDFSTPDKHRDTGSDDANRCVSSKKHLDDVGTPPRKIRFLLKIHTAVPTNIAIPVLMMQIDVFHRKNTWDDVGTPPRKIRFLLKIHTAGMDFSTDKHRDTVPDKHRDTGSDDANRCVSSKKTLGMMSEHHLENSISIENPYRRYGF